MATLTGKQYDIPASGFDPATRVLTSDTSVFTESFFDVGRMVVILSSGNAFKGLALVSRYLSGTELILETSPFDPVTKTDITVVSGDRLLISVNFAEAISISTDSAGVTASGNVINIPSGNTLELGVLNDIDSLVLFDENKHITAASRVHLYGGIVMLGRPADKSGDVLFNPVNVNFTHGAGFESFTPKSDKMHFFMYGGSFVANSPSVYVGGYRGTSAGSMLFNSVSTNTDFISPGAGGNWVNPERHVLRDIRGFSNGSGILVRYGDGEVSGGVYQISGTSALGLFGSDANGTYEIGAEPGKRLRVIEVGTDATSKPGYFRANSLDIQTINSTNVITPNRRYTAGGSGGANTNANGQFAFADKYQNLNPLTKIVILGDQSGNIEAQAESLSGGSVDLKVVEATIAAGDVETVVNSSWTWVAYSYGSLITSGTFATTTVPALNNAKNVEHGAYLRQEDDPSKTLSYTAAKALTVLSSASEAYDAIMAYQYDNAAGESDPEAELVDGVLKFDDADINLVTTASDTVAKSGDVWTLKVASSFAASLETTGTVTIPAGVTVTGSIKDSNGVRVSVNLSVAGAMAGAWLYSQGETDRTGLITATADSNGFAYFQLAQNQQYYIIGDAYAYKRSIAYQLNTATQTSLTITLERIVDALGNDLIPTNNYNDLTVGAKLVADAIIYDAQGNAGIVWPSSFPSSQTYWTPTADDLYNGLAYKIELIQSGLFILISTIQFSAGKITRAPTGTLEMYYADSNPTGKVIEWTSINIGVEGTDSLDGFLRPSTLGTLLLNSSAPIVATVDVGSNALQPLINEIPAKVNEATSIAAILADTGELQANQGDWSPAPVATPAEIAAEIERQGGVLDQVNQGVIDVKHGIDLGETANTYNDDGSGYTSPRLGAVTKVSNGNGTSTVTRVPV